MKKYFLLLLTCLVIGIIILGILYGDTLLLMFRSFKAFDEKNLAHSFQTMYEIQPSKKIAKGDTVSSFAYDLKPLLSTFTFRDNTLSTEAFL